MFGVMEEWKWTCYIIVTLLHSSAWYFTWGLCDLWRAWEREIFLLFGILALTKSWQMVLGTCLWWPGMAGTFLKTWNPSSRPWAAKIYQRAHACTSVPLLFPGNWQNTLNKICALFDLTGLWLSTLIPIDTNSAVLQTGGADGLPCNNLLKTPFYISLSSIRNSVSFSEMKCWN